MHPMHLTKKFTNKESKIVLGCSRTVVCIPSGGVGIPSGQSINSRDFNPGRHISWYSQDVHHLDLGRFLLALTYRISSKDQHMCHAV